MSIQSQCGHFQRYEPSYSVCIEDQHSRALDSYEAAISSKFDAGNTFTVSDVWSFAVAVWELPINGLQYLAAKSVAVHYFFELVVDDFLDPSPFLATPAALLTLFLISAVTNADNW